MPPFEYIQTNIKAEINKEIFIAKGQVIKSKGWKALYDKEIIDDNSKEDDLKDQVLPKLNNGDLLKINSVDLSKGQTKPPARFNEGTLLSAMENPQKY